MNDGLGQANALGHALRVAADAVVSAPTQPNLFQYRRLATLLILTYLLVMLVERLSAAVRSRIR